MAIIGRPNVGKSTLFNTLMGKRIAIVDDQPGVTRDRIFGRCGFAERDFFLVDTGGLVSKPEAGAIEAEVELQIQTSIREAHLLLFVVDAVRGMVPEDRYVAEVIRRQGKPVLLLANKSDSEAIERRVSEFYELGLGDPIPVSALQRRGIDDLEDALAEQLPDTGAMERGARPPTKFTVVGRPNVGKSSLVNAILGEERCVVSAVPGTTRDAVNTELVWKDRDFVIVDTAGVRKHKSRMDSLEYYSWQRTQRAVNGSDVAVLVLDAQKGLLEGDKKIADFVLGRKRGLVLAINKMDLIESPDVGKFLEYVAEEAPFLRNMPAVFVSALKREGIEPLFETLIHVHRRMNTLLPLDLLTNVVTDVRMMFSPPGKGPRPAEIRSVTHDGTNPPRIILNVNDPILFPTDYLRLMENQIRAVFDLSGVPVEVKAIATGRKHRGKKYPPKGDTIHRAGLKPLFEVE